MNSPLAQPRFNQTGPPGSSSDDGMPAPPAHRPPSDPRVAALRPLADGPGDIPSIGTSPAQPTKVDIRDINFFYGKFQALKNISVPLYDRRVTAFIGPSGCGKSTLLRIINRI